MHAAAADNERQQQQQTDFICSEMGPFTDIKGQKPQSRSCAGSSRSRIPRLVSRHSPDGPDEGGGTTTPSSTPSTPATPAQVPGLAGPPERSRRREQRSGSSQSGGGGGGGDEDDEGDDTDCSSSHIWSPAQSNSSSLLTLHGDRSGGGGGCGGGGGAAAATAVEPSAQQKRPRDLSGQITSGGVRRFGSGRDPVSRPQPTGCEADISSSGSTNSASCMSLSEHGARGARITGAQSLRTPSPCRGLAETPALTRPSPGRVPPPLPSPSGLIASSVAGSASARPSALPLLLPLRCAAPHSLALGPRSPAKPLPSPTTGSPRDGPIPLLTLLTETTVGSADPQTGGLVSPPGPPTRGSGLLALSPASSSSSSSSSLNRVGDASSPPARRWRYPSSSEGHGARSTIPEQHLTPLQQQRDVTIRHLRARLRDSEGLLGHREREVQELKSQLERMREDWVEEECHRVEAQLALKEARREIRQLREAVDVMEVSLHEKDQGLQKYFADIGLQNRKLEALLHSMEVAQGGARQDGADGGDHDAAHSPVSRGDDLGFADESLTAETTESLGRAGGAGVGADGGDGGGTRGAAAAMDIAAPRIAVAAAAGVLRRGVARGSLGLEVSLLEEKIGRSDRQQEEEEDVGLGVLSIRSRCRPYRKSPTSAELGVQADIVICDTGPPSSSSSSSSSAATTGGGGVSSTSDGKLVDLSQSDPTTILLVSPSSGTGRRRCRCVPPRRRLLLGTAAAGGGGGGGGVSPNNDDVGVHFWSRHAVLDWAAVAVPLVPTVAWLVSRHRAGELARQEPLYNIATALRGCCLLALSRLRVAPQQL
uniref:Syntaphilin-like n=1 Tax=Petromyzon marinus TaxID=7757 RepID=A0AAJ7TET2_PETMA|nr:syntaphilin-like [Petromyzon marinus]